jgi:GlpG protein
MIGQITGETKARTFSNYLYVEGIENQVEAEKDGAWALWIHSEEELERARAALAEYEANPDDPKFKSTARLAETLKERKQKEQAAYEKRVKERRHLFRPMAAYGFGPVTFALILISAGVFLIQNSGNHEGVTKLFISEFLRPPGHFGLPEVRHGEIWRLVTPVFLHFSIMHILFNMLCLRDLGSMIEGRQNSLLFVALTLFLAVGSNLAQYYYGGPAFGGMSGVVYGLLGYVWIRSKLDPGSGLFVHPTTVTIMIIWFFICMTPWSGAAVANGAHAGGLLIGLAWGWLSSLKHR